MTFLGTILEREIAFGVERADVAGVQPAALERRGRCLGIAPVARHDDIAAAQYLAGLARRQRPVVGVRDHDLDAGKGAAGGSEPLRPARAIAVGNVLFRQSGDRHRAFALAVDLRKPRAEPLDRIDRIGDVHRRAAPHDRPDILGIALRMAFDEPLDHGRSGEHRSPRPGVEQADDLVGFEGMRFRHHVDANPRHVSHHIEPRAVTHRGGVQQGVAGRDRIDLAGIGVARRRQHAMGEHGALRPSGGPGRVEQPSQIVAVARPGADRIGGEHGFVVAAADDDQPLQRPRRVRGDFGIEFVRGKANPGAGMLQDVAEFAAVKFGIGGHRGQSGMPNAEHQLDIFRTILGDDDDALAGLQREALAQRSGESCGAAGDLAVAADNARA